MRTWWKMSDEAHQKLVDEFGDDAVTSREFEIAKRYKQDGTSWIVPIDEAKAVAHAIELQRLNAAEKKVVDKVSTSKELIAAVDAQDTPTEKLTALKARFSEYRKSSVTLKAIDLLSELVPKFFYTSHYDRMSGQISAQQIAKTKRRTTLTQATRYFSTFFVLRGLIWMN